MHHLLFQPRTGLAPRVPAGKRLPIVLVGGITAFAAAGGAHVAYGSPAPVTELQPAPGRAATTLRPELAPTEADALAGPAPADGTPAASPTRGLCERTAPPNPTISGNVDSYSAEGWPVIAGKVLRLHGIETLRPAQVAAMKGWVANHNNYLECQAASADLFQCQTLRGLDLACIVLFNGGARANPEAGQSYRDAEQQAREARRGIWK